MFRIILLLFLFLSNTTALAALVLPSTGKIDIGKHREVLLDPDKRLSVSDLNQMQFSDNDGKGLGYIQGAAWMRFSVTRPKGAPEIWWLELQSPLLDSATLYFPQANGEYKIASSGDHIPLSSRDIQYRNPAFKLEFAPGKITTFYVRLEGRNTMSFKTVLWTTESFFESVQLEKLFFGLFLALNFLTILSSYWLIKTTKESSFSLLIAYATLTLVSTLCLQGYGYQYFWRDQPALNEALLIVSWMLLPLSLVAFNMSFVGALNAPRLRSVSAFLILTGAFAIISVMLSLTISPTWVRLANSIWNPIVTLIMTAMLGAFAIRGNENARILLIGMLLLWVSVSARTLRNIGLIDATSLTDNAYQIGMIAHLLLVQYALSRHYLKMRRENEQAHAEVLKLTQDSEKELSARVKAQTEALSETLHQLENALEKQKNLQQRQQLFLDSLSHELKTPLTIIDLSAQNLAMNHQLSNEEKTTKYEKILEATKRIIKVMEHHFDLSKLSQQHSDQSLPTCSPKQILSQVISASEIFSDHHTISIESEDLPDTVFCDPEILNLVLRCLLDNALKYSPKGSKVLLRGYQLGNRKGDQVCIEVIDEGPGISIDDLKHLFTPYFRSDSVRHIGGNGLGLTNAKRLINGQGGDLTVASTLGKGSCFRVTLKASSN